MRPCRIKVSTLCQNTRTIICRRLAPTVREDRERRRRATAVHQGRAREPRSAAAQRGDPRPHRPALRRQHVRRLLRGPRPPEARLQPRNRRRERRLADGRDDPCARGRAGEGAAGVRPRVRRHELDPRRSDRRVEDGRAPRTRGGGPPFLQPRDARGDQPDRRGPAVDAPVLPDADGGRQPRPRGDRAGRAPGRGRHVRRRPAERPGRAVARRLGPVRGDARRVPPGDAAPAGERARRDGTGGHPRRDREVQPHRNEVQVVRGRACGGEDRADPRQVRVTPASVKPGAAIAIAMEAASVAAIGVIVFATAYAFARRALVSLVYGVAILAVYALEVASAGGPFVLASPVLGDLGLRFGPGVWPAPWTWITFEFVHASETHVLLNLLGLILISPGFEERIGGVRWAVLFFARWAVRADRVLAAHAGASTVLVGASAGILAAFGAYGRLLPREPVTLFLPIPRVPSLAILPVVLGYLVLEMALSLLGPRGIAG